VEVLYFVLLVGVLIFIHELGHFAWAKFFGVEVQRFSIGFGPKIAGAKLGETEYVLAAFPIGGYVRMLGESAHDVIDERNRARSFQAQPLWKRTVIVLAGPAMNLMLPLLLFFAVHLGDDQLIAPVIGTVFPERPADGRLLPDDVVLAADGDEIATFDELHAHVAQRPGQRIVLRVRRGDVVVDQPIVSVPWQEVGELERFETVGRLGIHYGQPAAVVGVMPGSPAEAGGMRTFDRVISVKGTPVDDFESLGGALEDAGTFVPLTLLRVEETPVLGGLATLGVHEARVAHVQIRDGAGPALLRAGLETSELYVHRVEPGSPAARAGLGRGDRLISQAGHPVRNWATFREDLKAAGESGVQLVWRRGRELRRGVIELQIERGTTEHGQRYARVSLDQLDNWMPNRAPPRVENPAPLGRAAGLAWEETSEMVSLTFYSLVRLLQGRLGVQSLGGPIVIYSATREAARSGTTSYLRLMAFISVNLGLINLLPIPLLDGGHLLFFLVEGVSRRKVPPKAKNVASLIGLVLLVLLMAVAIVNDVQRVTQ